MPIFVFTLLILLSPLAASADQADLGVGKFSSQPTTQVFEQWQPFEFSKIVNKTRYTHVQLEDEWVIKAESEQSASGLIRKIDIDLEKYPVVSWRWKVTSNPKNATDDTREGDDHAARLYFIFNPPKKSLFGQLKTFFGIPNTHAINYIWAIDMEPGTFRNSPYTDQSIMFAVDTGQRQMGEWVTHRRNLLDDYRKIFDRNPSHISAVAVMTDTDNSQGQVTAYYGDIVFSSQ
jgi:hypothetical protein